MAARRLTESEKMRIAEAIILGQKVWDDFTFPTQDDMLQVKAIVGRGVQALGENSRRVKTKTKREIGGTVTIREYVMGQSLAELLTEVPSSSFSFQKLAAEPKILRRHLLEALHQALSDDEMALLLSKEARTLESVLSDKEKERFATFARPGEESPSGVASAVTLKFLGRHKDELTPALQEYVKEYRCHLQKQLEDHCRSLYKSLAIDKALAGYSDSQWRRLTGLTPRDQLGSMAFAITPESLERIFSCLPERQKKEVKEAMAWREKERERRLEICGDTLVALKKWVGLVNKIGCES